MKVVLDDCALNRGWVHQDNSNSVELTDWGHLTTSYLKKQLLFKFLVPSIAYIDYSQVLDTKSLPNIAFSIKCDQTIIPDSYSTYPLKIRFFKDQFTSIEFLIEASQSFEQQTFRNPYQTISRIEVETTIPIQFFISEIIAFKDDLPIDIFRGVQSHILQFVDRKTYKIGTLSGNKDSSEAVVSSTDYLDKYQCIMLEDGSIHQIISDVSDRTIRFGNAYDGELLKECYEDVPFYLYFPVELPANMEDDAYAAGITVSGFDKEVLEEQEEYSSVVDSIEPSGQVRIGTVGSTWKHTVLIEGMARHEEILAYLQDILTKSFNKKTIVYLNGRRHELNCTAIENPDYGDATDILNKIIVSCTINITEETWGKQLQIMDFQTLRIQTSIIQL